MLRETATCAMEAWRKWEIERRAYDRRMESERQAYNYMRLERRIRNPVAKAVKMRQLAALEAFWLEVIGIQKRAMNL